MSPGASLPALVVAVAVAVIVIVIMIKSRSTARATATATATANRWSLRLLALAVLLLLLAAPRTLAASADGTATSLGTVAPNALQGRGDESIQEYVTDPLSDSLVRVFVSRQEADVDSPWRKKGVELRQVVGAAVAGGRIVVPAWAVLDATFVEMSRFGDSRRDELAVVFVDQEVNVALLKPRDPQVAAHLKPLEISGLLPLRLPIDIVGWQNGQITRTRARLVDVTMRRARTSAYEVASYDLDSFSSGTSPYGPVIRGDKLVGLVDSVDDGAATALPATLIKHVLDDGVGDAYRGFPSLGFETMPLLSPFARRLAHAQSVTGGARVTEVQAGGSAAGIVRPGDVLLKVAGHDLDDYGRYHHPLWGRVSYKYLLNELHGGDTVSLTLMRDGKTETVNVKAREHLSGREAARPPLRAPSRQAYVVFGGLVLQELDRVFLESWGQSWHDTAPVELVMAAKHHGGIVVNRVLADEFNQGYEDVANRLVDEINGRPVSTLADVRAALEAPVTRGGKHYAVFSLAYDGGLIVLGYDGLASAHGRIAAKYGVDEAGTFFTPE